MNVPSCDNCDLADEGCSFGAAFPTFYRLVGPYRSSKAREIVETELWDTIKRRGVIGNIFMGVIPMVRPYSQLPICCCSELPGGLTKGDADELLRRFTLC